ncbi:hypothetical protein HDV06_003292 [Boothiomyces sp. JEL0866]|nr:hypothetical protein HDV06_003292 [Boothiomyces sp. JEL0866]
MNTDQGQLQKEVEHQPKGRVVHREHKNALGLKHLPALTGFRGVATLAIFYLMLNRPDHGQGTMGGWDTFQEFGYIAIVLFYVMTGFLLTYRTLFTLDRKASDVKVIPIGNSNLTILNYRWIAYFMKRFFKIYPAFLVALILAVGIPRFQSGYFRGFTGAYYSTLDTHQPLDSSSIINYLFCVNVQSTFWTMAPLIEFYLVFPLIIGSYEWAEYFDMKISGSDSINYDQMSFIPRMFMSIRAFIFRFLHLVLFTVLSLPGVLDTSSWTSLAYYNQNHLPPQFYKFWFGCLAAILLLLLERNDMLPNPPSKELMKSEKWGDWFLKLSKRSIFMICDAGCWIILVYTIYQFPWYQGNYFNVNVPFDKNWPAPWAKNTSRVFYHGHVYDQDWFNNKYTNTRLCGFMCAFVLFLVGYGAREGSFMKFFRWRIFTYAGEISYSMYLVLPIALFEYDNVWTGIFSSTSLILVDNLLFGLIVYYGIGSLLYWIVEHWSVKLGNYLNNLIRAKFFKEYVAVETNVVV